MGNWFSSKPEATETKNKQTTTNPESFTSQTNNVQPVSSNSNSHTTSVYQNISTLSCSHRSVRQSRSSATTVTSQSQPMSYATVAGKKCTKTRLTNNISSTTVGSWRTVISKEEFQRFQQIIFSAVLRQCIVLNWYWHQTIMPTIEEYQLISLEPGSYEYNNVLYKFSESIPEILDVLHIKRVENPYLMGQYHLKKLEYENKRLPLKEIDLFHGTKGVYVDNICRNNFDWRLHGKTEGNRFGQGVSFTPRSRYANHYCDRNEKVIIVAKVLISKTCEGNSYMAVPDYYNENRLLRYDTSAKEPTEDVLVKYCDDEFYPAYLINFLGEIFYPNKGNGYYR